ncbi:DUF1028 domain-containing protein [Planococcus lenghuensis]|uniref:Fimbrial assembly protein FimA n=1 Tax=Planococcus lenghuensis TaxID=2213202 RepID=A0A1Q2L1U0_9BACL|nr:DUF1028 domain-containing protein [Planococcus lenghuensis]AQQ54435.1 fimbrial assembly protein FimA [Planococcus lenghuensis]
MIQKPINTFSIAGFDPATGELGIAVASKFLGVGAVVPFAKAGIGAIATQSWANLSYGTDGLALLEQGARPEEVIQQLTEKDEQAALRQAGIVDAQGRSATFTGEDCYDWAGGIARRNFAAQGNILVSEETVQAMAATFENTAGSLAERLLAALAAGEEAGGDSRGKQSAALLVVKENGSYGGYNDRYIDLRVDDHQLPVQELNRIFRLHQLYFEPSRKEDIIKIEGATEEELVAALKRADFLKKDEPTREQLLEAVKSYHLIENFDERLQEEGFIDRKVLDYMNVQF